MLERIGRRSAIGSEAVPERSRTLQTGHFIASKRENASRNISSRFSGPALLEPWLGRAGFILRRILAFPVQKPWVGDGAKPLAAGLRGTYVGAAIWKADPFAQ